jgi:hypothetical protein
MDQQNWSSNVSNNALPSSTLAIVSLISAILGFTPIFPVVGGIVALITGYMAHSETRSSPPKASGDGMAAAGIVMGWIQMGLLVAGMACFIAYVILIVGVIGVSNQ